MKKPIAIESQHVLQGRTAKFVGDRFETWLDGQHEKAVLLGILAHIVHNQASSNVVEGRLIYTAQGISDYTGTLDRCGRSLAVEAKSTKTDRLVRAAIKKKQAEHLTAVANAGGLALLLVEFRHEALPVRCAIPWLDVPWIILRSAESVDVEAVIQWQTQRNTESCYLERFHPRGPRSTPVKQWDYPRE